MVRLLLCLAAIGMIAGAPTLAVEGGLRVKFEGARLTGAVRVGDIEAGEPNCSGIMIAPGWVLTAAHCPASCGMTAVLGSRDDQVTDRVQIEGRIRHPRYIPANNDTGDPAQFDVALVKLFDPLEKRGADGRITTRVALPFVRSDAKFFEDGRAIVYGYGITRDARFENGRLSQRDLDDIGFLRMGQFKIGGVEGRLLRLDDIDAKLKGGDSGAAILVPGHSEGVILPHYQVLGVVSFIRGNDALGLASVHFADWAQGVIDGDHAPSLCPAPVMNVIGGTW
ncbi:MAG: trypsin-like serine protease [Pseudomonadota bacterium]